MRLQREGTEGAAQHRWRAILHDGYSKRHSVGAALQCQWLLATCYWLSVPGNICGSGWAGGQLRSARLQLRHTCLWQRRVWHPYGESNLAVANLLVCVSFATGICLVFGSAVFK